MAAPTLLYDEAVTSAHAAALGGQLPWTSDKIRGRVYVVTDAVNDGGRIWTLTFHGDSDPSYLFDIAYTTWRDGVTVGKIYHIDDPQAGERYIRVGNNWRLADGT